MKYYVLSFDEKRNRNIYHCAEVIAARDSNEARLLYFGEVNDRMERGLPHMFHAEIRTLTPKFKVKWRKEVYVKTVGKYKLFDTADEATKYLQEFLKEETK